MTETDSRSRGLKAVLLSIAVAGALGYLIQLAVPALTSEVTYIGFSVFWSALYLGGSAMAGVQQEVARAAHPVSDVRTTLRNRPLRRFVAVSVVLVVLVVVAFTVVFPSPAGTTSVEFGVALVIGLGGYLLTSVLTGVLYGLGLWPAVAFAAIADAVIRAALVMTGLLLDASLPVLMLLVAAPFTLAAAATFVIFRRRVSGRFQLDVGLRRLLMHSVGTVVAAGASGLLISGMPLLMGAMPHGLSVASTAALILTITLTRAPIVVPIIALQSFFISTVFRGRERLPASRLSVLLSAAAAAILIMSTAGWFLVPVTIELISAGKYSVSSAMAAVIVASAGLVALQSLTSPMLIAARRHLVNALGWLLAALLTIMFLTLEQGQAGVALALIVPPVAGLGVHIAALLMPTRR